jgi:hypothetical protein
MMKQIAQSEYDTIERRKQYIGERKEEAFIYV